MPVPIYDFSVKTIDGKARSLSAYAGKVMLIVNTASECGFTPQYKGLEELHKAYGVRGLAVLGFPCNQFGAQEPGDDGEIAAFCERNFGVTFPMFAKIDVNGPNEHPLYTQLKSQAPGILGTTAVKWNFTKFLVNRDGAVVSRFSPRDTPEDIESDAAFVTALG